jgi:hypothetical protein
MAVFPFLKMGTKEACFQSVRKIHCDKLRLNINLRTGIKTSKQSFMMKAGMPSSPTDFDGCRRLVALRISESETEALGRESDERNH